MDFKYAIVTACVLLSAVACKPQDEGLGGGMPGITKDSCNSNSDCGSGKICNPGSLLCVDDVSVGSNEFAGSFELLVSSDNSSGMEQNLFARVNYDGDDFTLHDMMLMGAGGASLSFGATTFGDAGAYNDLLWFTLPHELVKVGSPMLLSDSMTPALYDKTGSGMLIESYTDETGAEAYHKVIGHVDSGVFTLTDMGESGQKVAGNFKGTLRPPVYISAAAWMDADCAETEVVDPFGWKCAAAFAGYDILAGIDAVLDCDECSHGFASATYDILGEGDFYQVNEFPMDVHSSTWDDGKIHTQAFIPSADGAGFRCLEVIIDTSDFSQGKTLQVGKDAEVSIWTAKLFKDGITLIKDSKVADLTSGQVKIAYHVPGPDGRISLYVKAGISGTVTTPLPSDIGDECSADGQCSEELECLPVNAPGDGNCLAECTASVDCYSGMTCEYYTLADNMEYGFCLHTLSTYDTGCMDWLDDMTLCQSGDFCVWPNVDDTDGVCMPWCDPSEGSGQCPQGSVCHAMADESDGACYRELDWGKPCTWEVYDNGWACPEEGYCIPYEDGENPYSICLPSCNPETLTGCPSDMGCWVTDSGEWGICFWMWGEGESCGDEELVDQGWSCENDHICAGDEYEDYRCREECTDNHSSCPSGQECIELTSGKWACFGGAI